MKYAASKAYFTERFAIATSPRDRAALRQLADAVGEAQAVIVRRLIRQEAQRRGFLSSPDCDVQGQAAPEVTQWPQR
jgi:hypothetical protein